jgi:hypothetical protein
MRTFASCVAIVLATAAAWQILDREYWAATLLATIGLGVFFGRRQFRLPGEERGRR